MKITDIVKVNISAEAPVSSRGFLNREAVACIILHQHAEVPTDPDWVTFPQATTATVTNTALFDSTIKKELNAWANTFSAHLGSIDQARFKRVLVTNPSTDDIATMVERAVYGHPDTGQKALATNIIQVQLIWAQGGALVGQITELLLRAIAAKLNSNDLIVRKMLYVTTPTHPSNITSSNNLAWHKSSRAVGADQVYESALSMGYYSALDFNSSAAINDVEYTSWNGAVVGSVEKLEAGGGGYSAVSGIVLSNNAEHQMLVGGVVGSGTRILTEYFMIVIAQMVTDELASLILNKIRYSEHMYGAVYSTVANVLDRFTKNQLFDSGFVSDISRVVNRDGVNYWTLNQGESLPWGYKLVTLPATRQDLADRVYTGAILYYALGNQIRTMELNALAIGGV